MVDALTPKLSGIGRYCWELARGLPLAKGVGSVAYRHNQQWIKDPSDLISGNPPSPPPVPKITRRIYNMLDNAKLRKSLVHGPNYFLPAQVDAGVITIHDLSVFKFPETHPADRLKQFEKNFHSSVERAVRIITDTETIRQELIGYFNISADRIQAIGLGFGPNFRPYLPADTNALMQQYGLRHGQYGLCVSTFEPRKKIMQLLSAWRELKADIRAQYPLVLAGAPGWLNDDLIQHIDRGVKEGWLYHLGFVREDYLPMLYAGAALFLYPSIYEGFGLPPLEAMACGIPAIVADQPCSKEICGDAAIYINPDDHPAFIDAIYDGLANKSARQRLIEKGLQRAGNYSWAKCISETVDLYRDIGKF